jgi:hypothetical protein
MEPHDRPGTVYLAAARRRDWLLYGAAGFLALALVTGGVFFVYGLSSPDDTYSTGAASSPAPAPSASTAAEPTASPTPSAVASPTPSAAPSAPVIPPVPATPAALRAKHSNLCLDATPGAAPDGAPLIQAGCSGAPTQQWTAALVGGTQDVYTVTNVGTGRCLDINGASKDDGGVALLWPCQGSANQQWHFVAAPGGGWALLSVNSDKCASVVNADGAPGAGVVQWTCVGSPNQIWLFG